MNAEIAAHGTAVEEGQRSLKALEWGREEE